jgi:hypothetical protein
MSSIVLVSWHMAGGLSDRAFVFSLIALFLLSCIAAILLIFTAIPAKQDLEPGSAAIASNSNHPRRIAIAKLAVVVLLLLLANTLRHIGRAPLIPLLVGAMINVLIVITLLRIISKTGRGDSEE